jgi:DNA polymerase I-like protein with 3'-5' exonuclease and polymerase domains
MSGLPKYKRYLIKGNGPISEIMEFFSKVPAVAIDTETTGLDPNTDRIRLLQVSSLDLLETYLFDFNYITNYEPIRRFLLDPNIIKLIQNGVFDTKMIMKHLSEGRRKVFPEAILDTMLGSQLLQIFGIREEHGLDALALRYADVNLDKELQKADWSGELSNSHINYAALDVEVLFPIAEKISEKIESFGMSDAWMVENRCVLAVAMMELYGVTIDLDELKQLEIELDSKMWELEKQIATFLPQPQLGLFGQEPINLRSSHQMKPALAKYFIHKILERKQGEAKELGFGYQWTELRRILGNPLEDDNISRVMKQTPPHKFGRDPFAKSNVTTNCTVCGLSLLNPLHIGSKSGETIKQFRPLEPEMVDKLVDYSSISQAYTTYCLGIPEYKHPITGKFHTNFFQLGQPQHRMAAKQPNWLNVPKDQKIGPEAPEGGPRRSTRSFRNIFKAEVGRKLIIADYDILQFKLTAARANEPTMIKVISDNIKGLGPDAHRATAMLTLNKLANEVTDSERFFAKSQNFALLFGSGPRRLQEYLLDAFGITLTLEEAAAMRTKFFNVYKGLELYHERQRAKVLRERKIDVLGGRRIILPINPIPNEANVALNGPAVLSEQSGIKRAMGDIARWLIQEQEDAYISLYVYDEIHIDSPDSAVERIARMQEKIMVDDMQMYVEHPDVLITCKARGVDRWSEK